MALTLSGTDGIVGAGFTLDASGASVTAGVGTFSSLQGSAASLTQIPAANLVGVCTSGLGNASGIFGQTGQGITMADMWHLRVAKTPTGGQTFYIDDDFTRAIGEVPGVDGLGSAMTKSGEVFTFPSTGIYQVYFSPVMYDNSGNAHRYINCGIQITTDNSSYGTRAYGQAAIPADSGATYAQPIAMTYVDVTDTANVKVKLLVTSENNSVLNASDGTYTMTWAGFIRLGDT